MRNRILNSLALLLTLSAGSVLVAGVDLPERYLAPRLDGPVVQIQTGQQGRTHAAWAYRVGSRFDIAVSVQEPGGLWAQPTFLGAGDGMSQIQPSLTGDEAGNVYLAYAVRETGQVYLSHLRAGADDWSTPALVVLGAGRHEAPMLRVIGGRLVLAFRTGSRVSIVDLPTLEAGNRPSGIQDGPDGFPLPGAAPSDGGLQSTTNPGSTPQR